MASKILINKKTGKEFRTSNPDLVLKKHPNAFRVKPEVKLAKDIEVKEATIIKAESKDKKETKSDKKD